MNYTINFGEIRDILAAIELALNAQSQLYLGNFEDTGSKCGEFVQALRGELSKAIGGQQSEATAEATQ